MITRNRLLFICAAFGAFPLFSTQLLLLWRQPAYQFFPFVLLFAAFVAWNRWKYSDTPGPRYQSSWIGEFVLLAFAAAVLAIHGGMFGPWLSNLSVMAIIAAGFLLLKRFQQARLWDIWLLLWVIVPPPMGLHRKLSEELQRLSSVFSSGLLDLIRIPHVRQGNVIQLVGRELFVDEACSGIVSVMSVIACAGMLAVWRWRSLVHSAILLCGGIAFAVIMNMGRITAIAIAEEWFSIDLSTGWPHDVLGLVSFSFTAGALYSWDLAMDFLLAPVGAATESNLLARTWNRFLANVDPTTPDADQANQANYEWRIAPKLVAYSVAAFFCVVGTFHAIVIANVAIGSRSYSDKGIQAGLNLSEGTLPATIGHWTRVSHEKVVRDVDDEFGNFSHTYVYEHTKKSDLTANVSLDFPFRREWHELCGCYRNSGWHQNDRQVETTTDSRLTDYVTATYSRDDKSGLGTLFFGILNRDFQSVAPPSVGINQSLWNELKSRIKQRRKLTLEVPISYQIQTFGFHENELSVKELTELKDLFFSTSNTIQTVLSSTSENEAG